MKTISILINTIRALINFLKRAIKMSDKDREDFLKKLKDMQQKRKESESPDNVSNDDTVDNDESSTMSMKEVMDTVKDMTEKRREHQRNLNNRMDDGDFWNKVRNKTSHDLDEKGNKIPELRSIEEIMDMVMENPKNINLLSRRERELLNEELERQQEEFKKLPIEDQKQIIDESFRLMSENASSDEEREEIRRVNQEFINSIDDDGSLISAMDNQIESIILDDNEDEEPEEEVDVDSFLTDVFGGEVETAKEYTKDDYNILVDNNRILFHIDYKIPARTHNVFADIIDKLELEKDDSNYYVFPRSATELKYWLKEYNIEYTEEY
jgi:hypothetical protein